MKRERELIGAVGRLVLRLAEQRERLSIEDGVRSIPRNRAVRLAGIEAAEVAAPSSSAAASTASTEAAAATAAEAAAASTKPPPPKAPPNPPPPPKPPNDAALAILRAGPLAI